MVLAPKAEERYSLEEEELTRTWTVQPPVLSGSAAPLTASPLILSSAVFAVFAIATAFVAFFWARSFFASWKLTSLDGSPPIAAETNNNNQVVLPENGADVPFQPETGPSAQPWDGKTRVTILLMGLDYRDCETEAGFQDCDTSGAARH